MTSIKTQAEVTAEVVHQSLLGYAGHHAIRAARLAQGDQRLALEHLRQCVEADHVLAEAVREAGLRYLVGAAHDVLHDG